MEPLVWKHGPLSEPSAQHWKYFRKVPKCPATRPALPGASLSGSIKEHQAHIHELREHHFWGFPSTNLVITAAIIRLPEGQHSLLLPRPCISVLISPRSSRDNEGCTLCRLSLARLPRCPDFCKTLDARSPLLLALLAVKLLRIMRPPNYPLTRLRHSR